MIDPHEAAQSWQNSQIVTTFIDVPRDYQPPKSIKVAGINDTSGVLPGRSLSKLPGPFTTWFDKWFTPTGKARPYKGPVIAHHGTLAECEACNGNKTQSLKPRKEVKPMATRTTTRKSAAKAPKPQPAETAPAQQPTGWEDPEITESKGGLSKVTLSNGKRGEEKRLVIVYAPSTDEALERANRAAA